MQLRAGNRVRSTRLINTVYGDIPSGTAGEALRVYKSGNAQVKFTTLDRIVFCIATELEAECSQ